MTAATLACLARLNRRSRRAGGGDRDVDWERPIDRDSRWAPPGTGALCHLPEYQLLDARERLRCNQLEAMGLCEQFLWLEADLAIPALRRIVARRGVPAVLREAARHFIDDELRHAQMFWRLLERSEPSWYRARRTRLFALTAVERLAVSRLLAAPGTFLAWLPVTVFAEERSLHLSRAYIRAQRRNPGGVDATYTQVHALHFADEVRHCQVDAHFLVHLFEPAPRWKIRIARAMFARFLRDYAAGPSTAARAAQQLGREFPRLRDGIVARMRARLRSLGRDPALRCRVLGAGPFPLTESILGGAGARP